MSEEVESPNFFDQNKRFIVLTLTVISFISLLSSLYVIATYICFKKIRNYAYKLVVYLSIADILLNLGNILSVQTIQNEEEDGLCYVQAVLVNYGGLASIIWTSVIAWSIFSATVLSAKNLREKNCRFIMFGFGFPMLLSILPFTMNQYGRTGFFCWIKEDLTVKDTAMRLVEFYIPLWIALAFNIYAYVKVIRFIKKYISTTLEIRFIHRLKYYPLILVFCWTFATINKIYTIFGKEVIVLTFLHVVFGGLQGLLNAIVFSTNDQVRQIWKEKLCNCMFKTSIYSRYTDSSLKKNEEMQQQQEQEEINEDIQPPHQDENNASVELVPQSDISETKKKGRKKHKLTIQV